MFNELRYRFSKFMQGRYGVDSLSRFLSVVLLAVIILRMFIRIPLSGTITLVILVILYWRMFSRNIPKRYEENQKFLQIRDKFLGRFSDFGSNNVADEGLPHLQMPQMQPEDPYPPGEGTYHGEVPQMRIRIPQEKLT